MTAYIGECCDLVLSGKEGVGVGCLRVIPTDLILVINSDYTLFWSQWHSFDYIELKNG